MSSSNNKWEADQMLNAYILDYLKKSNFAQTATAFEKEAKVPTELVLINAPEGFVLEWWSVFWDIFKTRIKGASGSSSSDTRNYLERQRNFNNNKRIPMGAMPLGQQVMQNKEMFNLPLRNSQGVKHRVVKGPVCNIPPGGYGTGGIEGDYTQMSGNPISNSPAQRSMVIDTSQMGRQYVPMSVASSNTPLSPSGIISDDRRRQGSFSVQAPGCVNRVPINQPYGLQKDVTLPSEPAMEEGGDGMRSDQLGYMNDPGRKRPRVVSARTSLNEYQIQNEISNQRRKLGLSPSSTQSAQQTQLSTFPNSPSPSMVLPSSPETQNYLQSKPSYPYTYEQHYNPNDTSQFINPQTYQDNTFGTSDSLGMNEISVPSEYVPFDHPSTYSQIPGEYSSGTNLYSGYPPNGKGLNYNGGIPSESTQTNLSTRSNMPYTMPKKQYYKQPNMTPTNPLQPQGGFEYRTNNPDKTDPSFVPLENNPNTLVNSQPIYRTRNDSDYINFGEPSLPLDPDAPIDLLFSNSY